MNWIFIIFVVISALVGLIQKIAKETGGKTTRPFSVPPPRRPMPEAAPPWLGEVPVSVAETEGEGVSLAETMQAALPEKDASEEGLSLESAGEMEPSLVPDLAGQGELARERLGFRAEAARLTGTEEPISTGRIQLLDEIDPAWDDDDIALAPPPIGEKVSLGRGWLRNRDDLVKAVLAAEILGRPGGHRAGQRRWRCPRF